MPFDLASLDHERAAHIMAAQQSVVQVRTGRNGAGSGVIIHRDGLIVTNAHVVRRRKPAIILANGQQVDGKILAVDEANDLAAISVKIEPVPALELGDSRRLRPGSLVVSVGHPWGVIGAATAGMVISIGHPIEPLPYAGELIQAGLRMRPGHSGGPMLDANGELVGINTMIAGPNVGLAVPATTVARFLRESLGSRRGREEQKRPRRGQARGARPMRV